MLDYRKMLQLNKQGASANAIAKLLGCKWDTVKRVLSRCENEWGSINGVPEDVDSIAIFGILSIPIFRIGKDMVFPPFEKRYFLNVTEFVDSIAIFGILSIPIFRIGKDMVFPPFGKRYFLNVIEFSGLMVTG